MPRARAIFAVLLLGIPLAGVWLLAGSGGLRLAAWLAEGAASGHLELTSVEGSLLGPIRIGSLRWEGSGITVLARGLRIDWLPAQALDGRLGITSIAADSLSLQTSRDGQASGQPPENLMMPFAVGINSLVVASVQWNDIPPIRDLRVRFDSDGRRHRLSLLGLRLADAELDGDFALTGTAPLPIEAVATLRPRLPGRPMSVRLQAGGTLDRIALSGRAEGALEGWGRAVLTPFAETPLAEARVALRGVDPARWLSGAPGAILGLDLSFGLRERRMAGQFVVTNREPGTLDDGRLPLARLAAQFSGDSRRLNFDRIDARLPGRGRLAGEGRWEAGELQLEVAARSMDSSAIWSALRSADLAGTIEARLAAHRQALKLALAGREISIAAEATHAGGRVAVQRLELNAGRASLHARGQLSLEAAGSFSIAGTLRGFNPAQFAHVPAGLLNAEFSAEGSLRPQPRFAADLRIADSEIEHQPLSGGGRVAVVWPSACEADLSFALGVNRLRAAGVFGRPGSSLHLEIEAPRLAFFGLDGDLAGDADLYLSGGAARPVLRTKLRSRLLGVAGVAQLRGGSLDLNIGGDPASPLAAEIVLERLDLPDAAEAASRVRVEVVGTGSAHRVDVSATVAKRHLLTLAATGGFGEAVGADWRGRLLEARIAADDSDRNFRLASPAGLVLDPGGWDFGPATLVGDPADWQATLTAGARDGRLEVGLGAAGGRLGNVRATLSAVMATPWSIASGRPWHGRVEAEIPDLGWLGEAIGRDWQTGGRLSGEMNLGGTPAKPEISGHWVGERLSLLLPDQGLQLVGGELAVAIANDRLLVSKLEFESRHRPPPSELRAAAPEEMGMLIREPGRIRAAGEMRINGQGTPDHAALAFWLDRVGVWQLSDQWVAVSGSGQIDWRADDGGIDIRGSVTADAGYWQLAPAGVPRLSDDVVIKRAGDDSAARSFGPVVGIDLALGLGQRFLFRGAGLEARLSGDLRLTAHGRDLPRAVGRVRSVGGRFEAYGQRLVVERGILGFQGLFDNPGLDVRAVRKGLPVEPGVEISGTAQRPIVTLVSDPDLPDAEKLSWLALGHGPEQSGAGDAAVLLSAAGGLLGDDSGALLRQIKKTFGVDELGMRQGEPGSTGGRQPSSRFAGGAVESASDSRVLSVGKRFGSRAMLSYEQAVGRAEGIVKLTVSLGRRIALVGRAGSENALDIFYTLTFGGQSGGEH